MKSSHEKRVRESKCRTPQEALWLIADILSRPRRAGDIEAIRAIAEANMQD